MPASIGSLPNEIVSLILSYLDHKNFVSLAQTSRHYDALAKDFFNRLQAENILDMFEKLLNCEGKNKEEIALDSKKIAVISHWLNKIGIVEQWGKRNDDASQLAYALTTRQVEKVSWQNKIEPILRKQKTSNWPHVIASVQKAAHVIMVLQRHWETPDWNDTNVAYINLKRVKLNNLSAVLDILQKQPLALVDLSETDLESANLEGRNLSNTNLEEANLKSAILKNANLSKANMRGANLEQADLEMTNFERANLSNARLEGTAKNIKTIKNLQTADITNVDFRGTDYYQMEDKELVARISANNLQLECADIERIQLLDQLFIIEKNIINSIFIYEDLPQMDSFYKALQEKTKTITGLSNITFPSVAHLIIPQDKKENKKHFSYKIALNNIMNLCELKISCWIQETTKNAIKSIDKKDAHLALKEIYRILFSAYFSANCTYERLLLGDFLSYMEMTLPQLELGSCPPTNKKITRDEVSVLIKAHQEKKSLCFFDNEPDKQSIQRMQKLLMNEDITDEKRYQLLWLYVFNRGTSIDSFCKLIQKELLKTKGENFFEQEAPEATISGSYTKLSS
jgi:uncharacterized protein YjbI with pentapeptide repeats